MVISFYPCNAAELKPLTTYATKIRVIVKNHQGIKVGLKADKGETILNGIDIFDPKHRYTYKTVGSFGHPVPLVAGSPQQPGAQAVSKTIYTGFTREKDTITLDIASAYHVPRLKKLERTMVYNRKDTGSVTFTDFFEYAEPKAFETAISTRAEWKQTSDNTLLLTRGNEKMLVTFSSPGNSLLLRSEVITEAARLIHALVFRLSSR